MIVREYPADPPGATPFCGTIVSSLGSEATVELSSEVGVFDVRFVYRNDRWEPDGIS